MCTEETGRSLQSESLNDSMNPFHEDLPFAPTSQLCLNRRLLRGRMSPEPPGIENLTFAAGGGERRATLSRLSAG
jgi:hypothetical protein